MNVRDQLKAQQAGGSNGNGPSGPAAMLDASQVDLVGLIRNGIPEPTCVPGCGPWLLAGKRYLIPAPAGAGKSLAALIIAVTAVEHGGTVVILDVENGADEYARRLEDILAARDPAGALAENCQQRLRYHAWPQLSLTWTDDDWASALAGVDLAIFDSSRLALSGVGLAEDKADDYSRFVNSLLMPLARGGTTTLMLDNTGHTEQERSRGTSAKADLNEVVFALKTGASFDRDRAGYIRLIRRRERFPELPRELHIHVGGDTYTAPVVVADGDNSDNGFRPTFLMERASGTIEANPGLSKRALRAAIRGKAEIVDLAVEILVNEDYVEARREGQAIGHFSLRPYTDEGDTGPDRVPVSQPCPNRVPDTVVANRVPVSPSKGTRSPGHGVTELIPANSANRVPMALVADESLATAATDANAAAEAMLKDHLRRKRT